MNVDVQDVHGEHDSGAGEQVIAEDACAQGAPLWGSGPADEQPPHRVRVCCGQSGENTLENGWESYTG